MMIVRTKLLLIPMATYVTQSISLPCISAILTLISSVVIFSLCAERNLPELQVKCIFPCPRHVASNEQMLIMKCTRRKKQTVYCCVLQISFTISHPHSHLLSCLPYILFPLDPEHVALSKTESMMCTF